MIKRQFSLIEVVIATMILALYAGISTKIASNSLAQTHEARQQWKHQHLLSMGAEFYLLFGHKADFPAEQLPEGYAIGCTLHESEIPAETIDESKYDALQGWILGEYRITLFYDGAEVDSLQIEKIVREDDLQ